MKKLLRLSWKRTVIAVLALVGIVGIAFQLQHRFVHGHFVSFGIHVDALSMNGSIGIPGQTKLYWAEMSNLGLWPVSFTGCDYVTDAFDPGTEYAYGIQRWNALENTWQTVSLPEPEEFCHTAPLSKIKADLAVKILWPGTTVRVMEWEAVGARPEFTKSDAARFVVFRGPGPLLNWETAIVSNNFTIADDVVYADSQRLRIKH